MKGPSYSEEHSALEAPLVQALPGLIQDLINGKTLSDLVESKKYQEEPFLKALHYLLIQGVLCWGKSHIGVNTESRKKMFLQFRIRLAGKKNLEIYETMVQIVSGKMSDPDQILQQFTSALGAKPSEGDRELLALYDELMGYAKEAIQFAKSAAYRRIKEESNKSAVEAQIKLNQIIDAARLALENSNFKHAQTLLNPLKQKEINAIGLRLLWCWATLVNLNSTVTAANKKAAIKSVEVELLQISPEEKIEALYPFVHGLVSKAKGEPMEAIKYFTKAKSLDSKFLPSQRELALLQNTVLKSENVFDKDLKDVFGSLFKKKVG